MVARGLTEMAEEKDGTGDRSKHPTPHVAYGGGSVSLTHPYSCEKLLMPGAAGHSSVLYQWDSQGDGVGMSPWALTDK